MEKEKKVTKKKIVVNKSKKPINRKKAVTVKKIIDKPIKKKTESKEKWYIWLKNNIVEKEIDVPKNKKTKRLIISLFAFFCFIVVVFSTSLIDYYVARKQNEAPYFTVRIKDNYNQVTIYYGTFYKAWKCDNGSQEISYGRFNNELTYCEIIPRFDENGIYRNPKGISITKNQMSIIKNYYFDDYIYFESNTDLQDAYKISMAINNVWWVKTRSEKVLNNDPSIEIAIFGKLVIADEIEKWEMQYTDKEFHKCIKKQDGEYLFANYNAGKNSCTGEWKKLELDYGTCNLAKKNTQFIKELVSISGLCK